MSKPVDHPNMNASLGLFSTPGDGPEFVEPTSLLSDEDLKEEEVKANHGKRQEVKPTEEGREDVEEGQQEEGLLNEDPPKLNLAEVKKEDAEIFKLGPAPETPMSEEQAFNKFKTDAVWVALRHNGIPLSQDGSDFEAKLEEISRTSPKAYFDLITWADAQARAQTNQYKQEKIVPYIVHKQAESINQFTDRYIQLMPDIKKYVPHMEKLFPVLCEKFPELRNMPVAAIPMLYQLAKEKELSKLVTKPTNKANLENGGARRPKTVKGQITKEPDDVEKAFGDSNPIAKRNKSLDTFFGRD